MDKFFKKGNQKQNKTTNNDQQNTTPKIKH